MAWQEHFARLFGPGIHTGTDLKAYLRQLSENGYRVHPFYATRLLAGLQNSMMTSIARRAEQRRFGEQWSKTDVPAPLFILGHWRSGTTHLHNLLARDDRFATPNLYQVMYPHIFLTTEQRNTRLLAGLLPKTRFGLDNMPIGWNVPYEDEFALAADGLSVFLGWAWPKRFEFYDRYLCMTNVTTEETEAWKTAWMTFLKKLTFKYHKPLILKSPPHTARVGLILKLFPEAKFIHVHRHPYDVFRSRQRLDAVALRGWKMHSSTKIDWNERILRLYSEMHTAFLDQLPDVPAAQFHEVRYEDLERDPMQVLGGIYESLSLPAFEQVAADMRDYTDSISGYRKNRHPEIPVKWKRRIDDEWERFFRHWEYDFG